jgi:hypothetical protein
MADVPPDDRTGAPSSATFDASSINPTTSTRIPSPRP